MVIYKDQTSYFCYFGQNICLLNSQNISYFPLHPALLSLCWSSLWEWEMPQTFIFCKSHLSCGFGNYCKQHRTSSIVGEWKIGSDSPNRAWSPIYWKWSGIIKNSQLETSCGEHYTLWVLWITLGNTHPQGFGLRAKTAQATLMESFEREYIWVSGREGDVPLCSTATTHHSKREAVLSSHQAQVSKYSLLLLKSLLMQFFAILTPWGYSLTAVLVR